LWLLPLSVAERLRALSRYGDDRANRARWRQEAAMGFGRGILLWLLGIPLPIIILLAILWR
jgi:hypothetical protein